MPLNDKFRLFISSRDGNYAMMFAILSMFLFGSIGFGLDLTNISRVRQELQQAADSASLIAAKEKDLTDSQRIKLAKDMLASNKPDVTILSTSVKMEGDNVVVDVSASFPNLIMGLLGKPKAHIDITSVATKSSETLEIAFALDVSGSMRASMSSGLSRIDELKAAVKNLIDKLEAETNLSIRAAIIPFTMNVNIGTNQAAYVSNTNHPLFAGTKWMGCVFERVPPYHIRDSSPFSWPAYIWPPMPDTKDSGDYYYSESDGTMDGYASLDEVGASDKSSQYSGPNFNCVRYPIVPLTDKLDVLKTKIDELVAHGNQGTLIAPAVSWGMRVLSPGQPFAEGESYGKQHAKILVVVTDGEQVTEAESSGDGIANQSTNSVSPWRFDPKDFGLSGKVIDTGLGPKDNLTPYGFIRDSRPFGGKDKAAATDWDPHMDELVDLSVQACDEVKKKTGGRSINVVTLGISDSTAPGTRVYDALRACASSPGDHYYIKDKNDLDAAFQEMLDKMKVLRLSS